MEQWGAGDLVSLRCVFTSVRKGHPGLPVVANAVASPQVLIAQATSSVFPHDRNAKVVSDAPVPSCKPLEFHTLSSVKGVVRNWLKHHKSATHSGAREACWYMVLVQIESRASHTVCYKGTQDADARVIGISPAWIPSIWPETSNSHCSITSAATP